MEQILEGFLLVAAISVALNVIFKKFQIPTIIGYIVTGTLISEFFNLKSNDEISHIAEFGIAFLMFTIGLEFSFKHLMSMKKEVFLNGGLQVCLSGFVMGVMLYYALHLKDETALIAGLAFALSSTAIVLKTLNDNGDVSKIYGRKALGILLFQDIAVIPILLMIDMFSSQDASINELLLKTFTSAVILIVVLFLLGKYIINWIFYKVVQTNSQEVFIATILFLVVGASTLAHFFGFSYSLGAFLAGMMVAETQYKHQIEVDLIPFRDLVLGLVFSIMVVKAIVVFAVLNIYLKRRVAAKTALSVCQIGEFALAVFGLMTTRNLLDVQTAQIFIAASVISMFATPFILKKLDVIADLVEREVVVESNETLKPQKLKNHIVVFGYDRLGQEVVLRLKETKLLYIVLDNDISLVELGRSRGENVFLGNVLQSNTLENACLDDAAAVIITVNNEQRVELIAQKIKDYGANIQTIIKANGEGNKDIFGELGENFHLISEERVMAKTLVHEALQCKIDHDVRA